MASKNNTSTGKKEPPTFDNSGTTYFSKSLNGLAFLYKLLQFYIIDYITSHKLEFGFILGLISYIIIVVIVFTKNPYDIITNTNEGLSILLMLMGGFIILSLLFFYKRKQQLFENEEKGTISYLGKILTSIVSIVLIVAFVYLIFNMSSYFSNFSKFIMMGINISIILGIITLALKFFGLLATGGEPGEKSPSWPKLFIKIITYIPCLIMSLIDYLKYQYQITTKPIVILLAVELFLIGLYAILPWFMEKIVTHNSSQLIEQPENLNVETNLGTFQEINYIEDQFNYQYAISSWIYINSNPPETNPKYDEYTSLLNVGDKPDIQFNVLKNKLRIKMKTQGKNEKIIYETTEFKMQRWNNIIINYDGSTMDIFINNELVSSTVGVIPYNSNTMITSGTLDGLYGGICNVKFYRNNISRGKINWLYNSVNILNPPII